MIKLFSLATVLWVACPVMGWWPGVPLRLSQAGLWLLASLFVIGTGWMSPRKRECGWLFGFLIASGLAIVLSHLSLLNMGVMWWMQTGLFVAAAAMIAERGDVNVLKNSLFLCAYAQIAVMVATLCGWSVPWEHNALPISSWGLALSGTVGVRGAASLLLGAASILSKGKSAWLFACASALTGSFSGSLPAFAFLLWPHIRSRRGVFVSLAALTITAKAWLPRLLVRLEALGGIGFLKDGWLTGWGLLPLPGGFGYVPNDRSVHSPSMQVWVDYHNTWVEWIARFGLIGLVILAVFLVVMVRKSQVTALGMPLLCLALFGGLTQSVEALPPLAMLGLWWVVYVHQTQEEAC